MYIELIATVLSGIGIYFLLKPPKQTKEKVNNKPTIRG